MKNVHPFSSSFLLLFILLPSILSQNIPAQLLFRRIDLPTVSSKSSSVNDLRTTFPPTSSSTSSVSYSPLCNDGTLPSIYYRNCSANWDRKPGDPDFCNVTVKRWIIDFTVSNRDYLSNGYDNEYHRTTSMTSSSSESLSFSNNGLYCYDEESCRQRSINLTTSRNLPSIAFPSGIALPYAEANPNLYKSHHVIVPYCTSDLYMGNDRNITFNDSNQTWYFHGYNLVHKVIDTLFYDLPSLANSVSSFTESNEAHYESLEDSLVSADEIILIGPLGIQVYLPDIITYITTIKRNITGNQSASVAITSICDGCGLISDVPFFNNTTANNCTNDTNCPYSVSLPIVTSSLWNYSTIPVWCDLSSLNYSPAETAEMAWKCLTAEYLLPNLTFYLTHASIVDGTTRNNVQFFIHLPQYDIINLLAYNVWPAVNSSNNSPAKVWSETLYAPHIRHLLDTLIVMFNTTGNVQVYSSSVLVPSPSLILSPVYYSLTTNCTDGQGYHYKDSLNEAVSSLIIDEGNDYLQCIDNCLYINCSNE